MVVCPACGSEGADESRFCGRCGIRLEVSRSHEERKVITALFCDLVGSTALGERLDAEDISRLLGVYRGICRRRIESHGGVVEKFIGDAIVGIFGVPVAHEDDPERAVRAGLRIVEDIASSDLGVEVRIGVNTGEALVQLDVDPRLGEGFATGDALNTAARLESAAPVMGVAVGVQTHEASEPTIAYQALPDVVAKGKSQPVSAWQALHPHARTGTEARDLNPFVGRELELTFLKQLFERSRSGPATEFCTIIAEPGLGKSRLVRELARHVDGLSDLVTWRQGRCLPYGEGISFWALGEIVKAQAGILESDDQSTVSTKLEQAITEPDPQTRGWIKARLAPLVGWETKGGTPQRQEVFTAWRKFLEQIAANGPTVLVVEDLHWADPAFVLFLEELATRTVGLPLLVVVTARPEVEERHPSWPPGRHSTVLSLPPLADDEVRVLIAEALPQAEPGLARVVLDRAGGSPLYAEQLTAMFRDRRGPANAEVLNETMIPSSVQALIAARIDGLPPGPKRALMEASVVGRTFWAGAVFEIGQHDDLDAAFAELVRRDLCRPVHPSTMEGDREYAFWHGLVRDVAYAELTRSERSRMHAQTALWLSSRTGEALGENAEIVVHHIDAALELASATSELDREALQELLGDALTSASQASMRTDVPKAIEHLERALEVIPEDDPRRWDTYRILGHALHASGDLARASSILEELLAHRQADGDDDAAADAAIQLSGTMWMMGEGSRGDAFVAKVKKRLGPTPTPALTKLLAYESMNMSLDHDDVAATQLASQAIAMAKSLGIAAPPRALGARGMSRVSLGDLEGEVDIRQASDGFLNDLNPGGASSALFNLADAMSIRGPAAALPYYEEAIELPERFGLEGEVWVGRAGRLESLAKMGRFDDVEREAAPILEWAADHNDSFTRFTVLASLGLVDATRGESTVDPEELADLARRMDNFDGLVRAAWLASEQGKVGFATELLEEVAPHALLGSAPLFSRLAVRLGQPELAENLLAHTHAYYPAQNAARLGAMAILAEADGEFTVAGGHYTDAGTILEELGAVPDQAQVLEGLGRCYLATGEEDSAVNTLTAARALWLNLRAVPRVTAIDEMLKRAGG